METNDHDAPAGAGSGNGICPVSGLKITRKPEWTDIRLTEDYAVTFELIGDRILHIMPKGACGDEGVAALFREREKVIREIAAAAGKFVELRNYAGITERPNRVARRQMVRGLRSAGDRLLGMIAFNIRPAVRLVASVGMRLYRFPFHVSLAGEYAEAVSRGLDLLKQGVDGGRGHGQAPEEERAGKKDKFKPYVDELVNYIGRINWEAEGIPSGQAGMDGHPFQPVFEAIDLLKTDLEDLLAEREQSLRALMEQQAEQRGIIETIEEGYYECDLAGTIVVVNEAFCGIVGRSREETVGENYRQGMDEAAAAMVFGTFNRVYRTGEPARSFSHEVIRPDGARCHVEVSAALIRDKDGHPCGFRGIVRDISERRRNEETLMMFRRFAEASGEGLGWSDLDGRIVYINQTMCRILGETDPAAAKGRPVTDYYDREMKKRLVHEITPLIMKEGEWKGELVLRRENGEQLPTLNDLFLIRDESGNPLYHAIIARDISDLKKAEQALRRSEEQYRVLYEYAGDAIFVAQDGVIKFPNLKGQAMFGYNREELAQVAFLERIHPEDRQLVLERYERRLKGDTGDQTYSFRIFNKSGELVWVQITSVPIEWEGRPGALIFMRDITHLKTMEEQLRQKYKMEAVGTLAGGIAHDFNNILAGIMGYADVVAGQTPPDTAAYRNLSQIRKAVMRARGLVKQLLTFSRSAEQDYSAVEMGPVVAEVVEMIRAMAPASVAVADNISADVCRVFANPVQIHAIVLNLCHNALQAMPDGGVLEVILERTGPGFGPAGSCCRLVVRDTGQGMTTEVRERIFEPYFTTRPPGQGTGLGLSVVHGVVANLGGTISVDSSPGAGSTFRILFPMMKEAGK